MGLESVKRRPVRSGDETSRAVKVSRAFIPPWLRPVHIEAGEPLSDLTLLQPEP
jgi:hypothetical protein